MIDVNKLAQQYFDDEVEQMIFIKTCKTILQLYETKDNLAISLSGGKDSTVLMHLCKLLNIDIPIVFCDTGLEFPEIKEFAYMYATQIVKPSTNFFKITKEYGIPAISKEQSRYVADVQSETVSHKTKAKRLIRNGKFSISLKYRWIIDSKFKLSEKCCYHLKKAPLKKLGYYYMTGERVQESKLRKQSYHQCILPKKAVPLRLWTEKMINQFIDRGGFDICSIYNDSRITRTGCMLCLYGCQYDDKWNLIKEKYPKHYKVAELHGLIELKDLLTGQQCKCCKRPVSLCNCEVTL